MNEYNKRNSTGGFTLPGPTTADLRGKQSVRATFKLSSKAIEALSVVALHLGIKQKSLFDHLLEDSGSLHTIAGSIRIKQFNEIPRVQKTFVLSRRTLMMLDEASKSLGKPRDALVEYSIQRLESVIESERLKHRKREVLLSELTDHWRKSQLLLEKSRQELGVDDPVTLKIEESVNSCINAHQYISEFIERGKIIEEL